jgi:hypothetical protein
MHQKTPKTSCFGIFLNLQTVRDNFDGYFHHKNNRTPQRKQFSKTVWIKTSKMHQNIFQQTTTKTVNSVVPHTLPV